MKKPKAARPPHALPTKEELAAFLRDNPGQATKRDIARAFDIKGEARVGLKRLLRELEEEGDFTRMRGRRFAASGHLPSVAVLDVSSTDIDGELMARPADWPEDKPAPKIILLPGEGVLGEVGIGDRVLARLEKIGRDEYEARLIRRLREAPEDVLGIYYPNEAPTQQGRPRRGPQVLGGGRIRPTDRKAREDLLVSAENAGEAQAGEIVLARLLPGRPLGLRHAKIIERIGRMGDPKSLSLIAIHTHDLPTRFPAEALDEARAAQPVALGNRVDLRDLPLVTIDPEDARDHDDAVWAAPDDDPKNPGGWRVIVAIADVSHYVRPGSALDREARHRGNSAYFPDRVVPMLPEALSADLCSLREGQDRPVIAVDMRLDAQGQKIHHRFMRGLMRNAANINYGQAQRAIDGQADAVAPAILENVLRPLFAAYRCHAKAIAARAPLDLDLPERKVVIGQDGYIQKVVPRERFESHRLIEAFMILANVAAAETLEGFKKPCMYRVHDEPDRERIESLREFLSTLDVNLAKGQSLRPQHFNQVLARVKGSPYEHLVNMLVLRSQAQAVYSPENLGHFGLNLRRYAHFTSPIRRYSDLLVHRALIAGMKIEDGSGLSAWDIEHFTETAEHISMTERRAMLAEREALDRFTAAWMADRVGATFPGRIVGVTRFGLFVELPDTGASGLVPIRALGDEFFDHDEERHALVGRSTGLTFRLGDMVRVELAEAEVVTGGLRFELVEGGTVTGRKARARVKKKAAPQRRGRRR